MLAGIGHRHTEMAFPLVDYEPSALEYSLFLLVIEVLKCNKVSEQTVEVAIHIEELIHVNNLLGYPTCADIRKNHIRIKVLIPQLYPDAPRSYWEIYLIKLRYNK